MGNGVLDFSGMHLALLSVAGVIASVGELAVALCLVLSSILDLSSLFVMCCGIVFTCVVLWFVLLHYAVHC